MLMASSMPRMISIECLSTLSMSFRDCTLVYALRADTAQYLVDGPDGLLVLDDVAVLG
jgi:hypothetical protein